MVSNIRLFSSVHSPRARCEESVLSGYGRRYFANFTVHGKTEGHTVLSSFSDANLGIAVRTYEVVMLNIKILKRREFLEWPGGKKEKESRLKSLLVSDVITLKVEVSYSGSKCDF